MLRKHGVLGIAVIGLVLAALAFPSGAEAPERRVSPSVETATGSPETVMATRSGLSVQSLDDCCGFDDVGLNSGCIAIGTFASPPGGSYQYSGDLGGSTNVGTDAPGAFPLDPASLEKSTGLAPGTYTITQVSDADTFPHGPLACDGIWDAGTLTFGTDSITIDLDAEEWVTCDFLNEAQFVELTKSDLAGVAGAEFAFTGSFGDFSLTDSGSTQFKVPSFTTYTVTEAIDETTPALVDGIRWDLVGLDCVLAPAQPGATSDLSSVTEDLAGVSAAITFADYESRTVSCAFSNDLCTTHPFGDVPAWMDPAADWAYCGTYMEGFPGNLFKPGNNMTRAQVANLLHGLAGSPPPGAGCAGLVDVPAWAQDAICWLVNQGHAAGYSDHTFKPNNPITRAQVTRMLFRVEGSPPGAPANTFGDVPNWVDDAVDWITDPSRTPPYASGYPGNVFKPNNNITRAENTRMVCRINTTPGTC